MGTKKFVKKTLKLIGFGLLTLLTVLVINTLLVTSKQPNPSPGLGLKPLPGFAERLSGAIQLPTINHYEPSVDSIVFTRFHEYLRHSFPKVFKSAELQLFEYYALLISFKGSDTTQKPIVLLAHQDVVPADSSQWHFPPFKGLMDQTHIKGRGTLDDKGSLMAILEAMEKMLTEGFIPQRSIYLAFGADEELDGKGAAAMANWMLQHKLQPAIILDEGLVITNGMVPMIDKPVALIGTAEKGYASIKLSIVLAGGHSSAPGKETAISVLSSAVLKATQSLPQTRICQAVDDFMYHLCPETAWPERIVFANRWLFNPLIKSVYKSTPSGTALVSTTAAATVFNAGTTDNVLPSEASAIINCRILPGETTQQLMERLTKLLDDPRIKLEFVSTRIDPSPVSPIENEAFKTLATTVRQQFPEALVMPNLMIATSDSRHYAKVCPYVYKFAPYNLSSNDLEGIHGTNERIKIADYARMISFYAGLLQNFDELP